MGDLIAVLVLREPRARIFLRDDIHSALVGARRRKAAAKLTPLHARLYGICGRQPGVATQRGAKLRRSEEHTSELPSLMRISYAVFCLKKTNQTTKYHQN